MFCLGAVKGVCACKIFSYICDSCKNIWQYIQFCLKTSQDQFKNNTVNAHGYHHLTNLKQ